MIMLAVKRESMSLGEKGRAAFVFGRPVCPECINELSAAEMPEPTVNDRFGIITRTYYGWCTHCNCGCEVEQFKVGNGRWFIHRWRPYSKDARPRFGCWVFVRELPTPLVTVGVSREYDLSIL